MMVDLSSGIVCAAQYKKYEDGEMDALDMAILGQVVMKRPTISGKKKLLP
jgi:hypothetical protein